MVVELKTRVSRARQSRAMWPIIIAAMIVIGAIGGTLIATGH
jgi:hypothetical protein